MTHPGAATGTGTLTGTGTAGARAATGQPVIRVLRGNPNPAELAALVVALVTLNSGSARVAVPSPTHNSGRRQPGWLDGHRGYRAPGSWARHGTAPSW